LHCRRCGVIRKSVPVILFSTLIDCILGWRNVTLSLHEFVTGISLFLLSVTLVFAVLAFCLWLVWLLTGKGKGR